MPPKLSSWLGTEKFFRQTPPMAQIKFGTDGWRAVIAEDFTFANVARVAQATADYWNAELEVSFSNL